MVGLLFYGTFKVTTSNLLLYANSLLDCLYDVMKIQWASCLRDKMPELSLRVRLRLRFRKQ